MSDSSLSRIMLLLAIVAIAWLQTNAAFDYCQYRCDNYPHVMCRYPPGPNIQTCTGYMNAALTEEEKEKLLNDHNVLRQKLAVGNESLGNTKLPPASNMLQLLWDEELSEIAQRIVDQCPSEPALEKCTYTDRFQLSQMMVTLENMPDIGSLAQEIVKSWYDGKDKLTIEELENISAYPESREHLSYTQMMWAKSEFLGCARSAWLKNGVIPSQQIVCMYGPAGNIMNEKVYKQGLPCSHCPLAAHCSGLYPGLCVRFIL